ncbi:thioesterase domain-containing protein, partial [Corynebacterium stationis]
ADVIVMVEEAVSETSSPSATPSSESSAEETEPTSETAAGLEEAAEAMGELDAAEVADADIEPQTSKASGVGVAPRDASERMVFATWATFTGAAAGGVTSELPAISDEQAAQIAERLTARAGVEVTAEQVKDAETLEPLSDRVREGLESEVEGNIRVLREADGPAVFMFHPAGGTTVVYQPLMRRLGKDVAVYGVERLEGTLEERAAAYLDDIVKYARGRKVILGGWSFGGALAFEVALQLEMKHPEVEVAYISLLDTTQPSDPAPDTLEETKARWERYAAFAKKTYGLEFPVPYELLETAGEAAVMQMLEQLLATTDASEHGLAAGVLEHQRASFVDNQILSSIDFIRWVDVKAPVLLFRSERMHDGAIELEPRYAHIDPDGGWGAIVEDLKIVQLPGDHLAVPDEPVIGIVAKHMDTWIEEKIRGNGS